MTDWNDPTPFQFKALHQALLFAYPTPPSFNLFVALNVGGLFNPIGGTYEQGLLQYLIEKRAAGDLALVLDKANRDKPRSPKLLALRRSENLTAAEPPPAVGRTLEDIVRTDFGAEDLFLWTEKLELAASRVCRIEYPINQARGTGWLVGPDLVLTNWHVLDRAIGGAWNPTRVALRFDYAVTSKTDQPGVVVKLAANGWNVDSSPPSPSELGEGDGEPTGEMLDYALVRLERPLGEEPPETGSGKRGWFTVSDPEPAPKDGDILLIVQHPDGEPVKLAIGAADGVGDGGWRLYHTANTAAGSSGAPVLDAKLRVLALHHAGDILYAAGEIGKPKKNQAIPIGLVRARLAARQMPAICEE